MGFAKLDPDLCSLPAIHLERALQLLYQPVTSASPGPPATATPELVFGQFEDMSALLQVRQAVDGGRFLRSSGVFHQTRAQELAQLGG